MSTLIERQSLKKVVKNLNKEIRGIKNRSMTGMINAAIVVRQDMDKTPPLIPVGETGNLRKSWFITPIPGFGMIQNPTLILGFSANYARYVHEMYGASFRRPMAGAGFFAASLNRNRKRILEEIRKEARVE